MHKSQLKGLPLFLLLITMAASFFNTHKTLAQSCKNVNERDYLQDLYRKQKQPKRHKLLKRQLDILPTLPDTPNDLNLFQSLSNTTLDNDEPAQFVTVDAHIRPLKTNLKYSEPLDIEITIRNNNSKPLHFFKMMTPFDQSSNAQQRASRDPTILGNFFAVTKDDAEIEFNGLTPRLVSNIDVEATPRDQIITLLPGESAKTTVRALKKLYKFPGSGSYGIQLQLRPFICLYGDDAPKNKDIVPCAFDSEKVEIKVIDGGVPPKRLRKRNQKGSSGAPKPASSTKASSAPARAKAPAPTSSSSNNGFSKLIPRVQGSMKMNILSSCDASQKKKVENAVRATLQYIDLSYAVLRQNICGKAFRQAFFDQANSNPSAQFFKRIRDGFERMAKAGTINFNCVSPNDQSICQPNVRAYVWPNTRTVNFCPGFFGSVWNHGRFGSRAGTILHEMSHLMRLGDTSDKGYGKSYIRTAARQRPNEAKINADSWEIYADLIFQAAKNVDPTIRNA